MDPDAFDTLLAARHSCRAFRPDPVPPGTIEAILTAAQRTASWNNLQPWQVIVTCGAGTERLRALLTERAEAEEPPAPHVPFPERYEGIYRERRRACGFQLYDAVGIKRGDREAYARQSLRNFRLFDAPHTALVTSEADLGPYALLDCGGFVTNFMNAATAHGVATIAQAAVALHSEALAEHFDLPQGRRVVCAVSFGFADTEHPVNRYRVPRAPLNEVVTWAED